MDKLTITQPDDMHCHLRDNDLLSLVVPHTSAQFSRAIVMPNLANPITTVKQAEAYRKRILNAVPTGLSFQPLMVLYLTETTSIAEIKKAAESNFVHAIKYYPAGATTNSAAGVKKFSNVYPQLEAMQKYALPLLVHGEVVDPEIDIFDREKVFIDTLLAPLVKDKPDLNIVFEHMTTSNAVDFVMQSSNNIAATITPQHLLYNRNQILVGGIKPHYFCLPVLKREEHRLALNKAATSGNPKFFAGTDSAPHLQNVKESSCGCAGCYTAPIALELYAKAFEQNNALDKLEAFTSFYGADFYALKRNNSRITLVKKQQEVKPFYETEHGKLIPLEAGTTLDWSI
jgi:dihydroorotase